MEKFLIVKGCAGLGNRLTTLLKAIEYAKATNRTLFVDWDDGMFAEEGENAFFKYFELKNVNYTSDKNHILQVYREGVSCYPRDLEYEDIEQTVYNRFHVVTPIVSKFVPYKYLASWFLRDKLTYIAGLQSVQKNGNNVDSYLSALMNICKGDNIPLGGGLSVNHNEDLVLFYDARPIVDMSNLVRYVSLKYDVANLVNSIETKYNIKDAIGVHVRYTDKKPMFFLSRLYKEIGKLLRNNPSQRIFLCTDNNDVVEEFKSRFGDNVFQIEKYLPKVPDGYGIHNWGRVNISVETKKQMAIDCISDMWLLSRCNVLYWQGNSSFSYISKFLKDDSKTTINWMKLF